MSCVAVIFLITLCNPLTLCCFVIVTIAGTNISSRCGIILREFITNELDTKTKNDKNKQGEANTKRIGKTGFHLINSKFSYLRGILIPDCIVKVWNNFPKLGI